MPSLVTRDRLVLAACAVAAVVVPAWILSGEQPAEGESIVIGSTPLDIAAMEPPVDALAAPLFNPSREAPISDPSGNMTDGTDVDVASAPAAQPPAVVGVIIGRGTPGLVLARGGDGQTRLLHPGDIIDGWQVGVITASGADFEMAGRRERVGLDFAKPGSSAPASDSVLAPPAGPPADTSPPSPSTGR